MKDIQKATGLGLATISKYINGGPVRPQNRKLLDEAVAALGYRMDDTGRALKTRRTHTVGVLIPELSNLFATTIVSGVEDALRQRGYGVLVCDCRSDEALEREALEFLLSKRVDGILTLPLCPSGDHLEPAERAGVPVVLIDRKVERRGLDCVLIDNRVAALEAVNRLIALGHRRIGLICGQDDIFTFRERRAGYRDALLAAGLQPDPALDTAVAFSLNGGYGECKRLLALPDPPTAVFATNHEMTLGAWIALQESGLRIPDQLSFIGFDNEEMARAMTPRLTTVCQPLAQIAQEATALLLAAMERGQTTHRTVILDATLREGGSAGQVPERIYR